MLLLQTKMHSVPLVEVVVIVWLQTYDFVQNFQGFLDTTWFTTDERGICLIPHFRQLLVCHL